MSEFPAGDSGAGSSALAMSSESESSSSTNVGSILKFHCSHNSNVNSSALTSLFSSSKRPITSLSFFDLKTKRESGCHIASCLANFLSSTLFFLIVDLDPDIVAYFYPDFLSLSIGDKYLSKIRRPSLFHPYERRFS